MAAYGLYTHIAANKFRSTLLLGALFLLVYVMVFAGALVARFGARRCVLGAGLLMLGALGGVLRVDALGALFALMLLLGAGSALFDVAINAEGNGLELRARRKVMSGLHAMFSLGGMAGALLCFALHRLGVDPALQLGGAPQAHATQQFTATPPQTKHRPHSEQ